MIKCQTCERQNIDGSQYCDECGAQLIKTDESTAKNSAPNRSPGIPADAVFQSSNITSIGIPAIADILKQTEKSTDKAGQSKTGGVHSRLKIERGESIGAEFSLSADESFIGRWDADNGIFPDVDLDAHDPEAKVSRRHARITREGNGIYQIEDLGSTNGTFVNRGRRLIPGAAQPIKDGDEIIVGKTFMRFYINQ